MKTASFAGARPVRMLVFCLLSVFCFVLIQPVFAKEKECCWIDVKTGKPVGSVPASALVSDEDGHSVVSSTDDFRTNAFNHRTKQNYGKDADGCWIDVKTGKRVGSVPASALVRDDDGHSVVSSTDDFRTNAFNHRTKQNYAREPCPKRTAPPLPTERVLRTQPDPFELEFGYNYINAPDEEEVKNLHGFNASFFVNVNSWLAFGGEFAAGFGDESFRVLNDDVDVSLDRYLYLLGPRVSVRPTERFRVFAQAMVGGVHDNTDVTISGPGGFSANSSTSADSWAFDFGVGADWRLTNHWSWRIIQADYLATTFSSFNNDHWQDNWRLSTGIVFSFGGKEPPRPNDYSKERPFSVK